MLLQNLKNIFFFFIYNLKSHGRDVRLRPYVAD